MLLSTLTESEHPAKGLLGPEQHFKVASAEVAQTATETWTVGAEKDPNKAERQSVLIETCRGAGTQTTSDSSG